MNNLFLVDEASITGIIPSSSLLTPPLSPTSSEDVPFKPDNSDKISLSMKQRHHGKRSHHRRRRRQNRACLSSSELHASELGYIKPSLRATRSRSLPSLIACLSEPPLKTGDTQDTQNRRLRRWTLPSKATATRSVVNTVTINQRRPIRDSSLQNDTLSPAMITLRRATTLRSHRPTSLTFFPTPHFKQSRSSFLSAILSTIVRKDTPKESGIDYVRAQHNNRRKSKSPSLESDKAQPTMSVRAPTVSTEVVDIEPSISQPGQTHTTNNMRRCSTRYMNGNVVYEILWDEHPSSSTSECLPSDHGDTLVSRKQSVAMDMLETQMVKAIAQSRRDSAVMATTTAKSSSTAAENNTNERQTIQDLLNFKFVRFANEDALKRLPRSKYSRDLESVKTATIANGENEEDEQGGDRTAGCQIEFFPPLKRRASLRAKRHCPDMMGSLNGVPDIDPLYTSTWAESDEIQAELQPPPKPNGLIGASSRIRRPSASVKSANRQRSNAVNATTGGKPRPWLRPGKRVKSGTAEDVMPLLGRVCSL